MKKAVLQVADTGPLESLIVMLQAAGYECYRPSKELLSELRSCGGLVLDPESLVSGMGYSKALDPTTGRELPQTRTLSFCDLFVDVKAHQTYPRLIERWPNLTGRVLWYRINGGKPEHVINERGDHGDEVNPPCPVLTPNQWYRNFGMPEPDGHGGVINFPHPVRKLFREGRSYACWPPFVRFGDYLPRSWEPGEKPHGVGKPICLIHAARGWGYEKLFGPLREQTGLRIFGAGSPSGLIRHGEVKHYLSRSIAMIHLKSSDAPGYALYEAMAAKCPIIVSRRLIWRCRMQELLIPGETCLTFDRETHDPLSDEDVTSCLAEISEHLSYLSSPENNARLGEAAHHRLKEVMWSADNPKDVGSLRTFLERNFP